MIHSRLQTEPIQEESLRNVVGDDPVDDHLSEKIKNQNVSDCVKFIRTAISDNDPQVAKDIQTILVEQTPEEKQQIWDALTADEKSAFRSLISKSSTEDECGSDGDQLAAENLQKWADKISADYKK